ncbi:MAG: NADH-quinone oxidoreductase subunit NuoB ['Candidatus Kapabacteria' thiocyanatum]|uniref:NADH-quinone oxidoreductase subunit B n=1 Tax=Candidatus Kapaibacterium thiocyanatum TaxID=1895771 RepID=A0A1M3L6D5_9BACT|nr:NADH-quinone oxidoreductase subunit NuoB ['Candidatus Kapabacteria' thiocyanatum]OJX61125.1 MAG: NADH-quinone oxidoreductase subunit B ['Candidatus Kapabacteria' thiocyanatum]
MGLNDQIQRDGFVTTTIEAAIAWAQKNSLWPMPLGISCCAIEMMAFGGPRMDSSRFGSERFSFSPRQADLMIVAGTVTYKMSWVVRKIWDQMPDPKWCIAMGVCTSTGGMFRSYPVVQGIDQFLPVDAYVSGCPPRPEALIKALMFIQDKVAQSKPQLINLGKDSGDVRRSDLIVTDY